MAWQMVKLGDICSISKGKTEITKAIPGEYPMVALSEDRKSHNEYQFDEDAVIIPLVSSTGHGHASMKRIHFQSGKFALGTILCALIPKDPSKVSAEFLYHYLDMMKEILFVPLMKGVANVSLPMKRIAGVEIPLPALSEQESIVEILQQHKGVYKSLDHESEKQKKLLAKYRQAILQEAIEGKLTADWRAENPDVEPAAELLKRIAAEKAELIKQKKIPKQNSLPEIKPDEIPFYVPESWEWCRAFNFAVCHVDCPHDTPKYQDDGIPCLRAPDVIETGLKLDAVRFVSSEEYERRIQRLQPQKYDFVYIREGGRLGIGGLIDVDFPVCLGQRVMLLRFLSKYCAKYASLFFNAPKTFHALTDKVIGAASPHVNVRDIIAMPIPLPPLAEQQEIVRRVEAKFALCDNLEEQISAASQIAETLSAAILQELFDQNGGKN